MQLLSSFLRTKEINVTSLASASIKVVFLGKL